MKELPEIPDNSGDRFKQLVHDICRLEAIADDLLAGDPEVMRMRLEQYLQKAEDPDQAAEKFAQILETTDFSTIRKLANLLDPNQAIPEEELELDAPL